MWSTSSSPAGPPSGAVAGTVRDAGGRPLAGATVELFGRHVTNPDGTTSYPVELKHTATTDAAGRFRLAPVPDGRSTLRVTAAGFAPQDRAEVATGSEAEGFLLVP